MLENSDYRVCSDHFVDGEPAKLYDFTNPNWLPTLNLGIRNRRTIQITLDMNELSGKVMNKE